jgi:hypothetical protein
MLIVLKYPVLAEMFFCGSSRFDMYCFIFGMMIVTLKMITDTEKLGAVSSH